MWFFQSFWLVPTQPLLQEYGNIVVQTTTSDRAGLSIKQHSKKMISKNVRFGALSAAGEPIPGCPVCDISMKMVYVPWFGNQMGLRRRHQGRHRHYNSIRHPKQWFGIKIQNETTKQGAVGAHNSSRDYLLINASQKWRSTVPWLVASTLVAPLQEALWQGALCCGGTKVGAAITRASGIQNKNPK